MVENVVEDAVEPKPGKNEAFGVDVGSGVANGYPNGIRDRGSIKE